MMLAGIATSALTIELTLMAPIELAVAGLSVAGTRGTCVVVYVPVKYFGMRYPPPRCARGTSGAFPPPVCLINRWFL
jgi:hypothetical protein